MEDDSRKQVAFHNNHNVYILGAGFSADAGYPLMRNFIDKMREAAAQKKSRAGEKSDELEGVLRFRLEASSAAYRVQFDPENVEDLFSLTAAVENTTNIPYRNMVIAIAETLEFCRFSSERPQEAFPGMRSQHSIPIGFRAENPTSDSTANILIDRYQFYGVNGW